MWTNKFDELRCHVFSLRFELSSFAYCTSTVDHKDRPGWMEPNEAVCGSFEMFIPHLGGVQTQL